MSPIRGKAIGGSVQSARQASSRALSRAVAADDGQAVVYLTHLVLDGLEFIPGFDAGQGFGLGFRVGADVFPLP